MGRILTFRLQKKSKILFLCERVVLAECNYAQEWSTLMACRYTVNSWLADEKASNLLFLLLKYLLRVDL